MWLTYLTSLLNVSRLEHTRSNTNKSIQAARSLAHKVTSRQLLPLTLEGVATIQTM